MTRVRRHVGCKRLLLTPLLVAGLVSCSEQDDSATPLPPLRFAFLQSVDYIPYLVMREQGFDRSNGFRLVEVEAPGGRAALDAMLAGTVDAAYAGSVQVFADALAGKVPSDLLAVGAASTADRQHPTQAVVVGRGVQTWRDLDGKAIGVNQIGSLGEVATRIRLQREGVEGFRFVEIEFANQGLTVAGGDIAAAVMSEPFLTQSLLRGDGTHLDWVIGGSPFPEFPYTFIVVRAALARDHPEVVRGLLRAHLQALDWIKAHEDDSRALLARKLGLDANVAREMRLSGFVPDARFDPDLIASVQATLAAEDPRATPVPANDLYDERLLLEVLHDQG